MGAIQYQNQRFQQSLNKSDKNENNGVCHFGNKGSNYLTGRSDLPSDYDWDRQSMESEEESYNHCEERLAVTFDNGAEYTG